MFVDVEWLPYDFHHICHVFPAIVIDFQLFREVTLKQSIWAGSFELQCAKTSIFYNMWEPRAWAIMYSWRHMKKQRNPGIFAMYPGLPYRFQLESIWAELFELEGVKTFIFTMFESFAWVNMYGSRQIKAGSVFYSSCWFLHAASGERGVRRGGPLIRELSLIWTAFPLIFVTFSYNFNTCSWMFNDCHVISIIFALLFHRFSEIFNYFAR